MIARIRAANLEDAGRVREIYAPAIENASTSFEMVVPSVEEMQRRMAETTALWPWLVYELNGLVVGYAYARPFRARAAYGRTAETSVYIDGEYHGQGIGRALMGELLRQLKGARHHMVIAGATLPNPGSVALHEKLGFLKVGVFPEVGRKLGKWHDVGFWSLRLDEVELAEAAVVCQVQAGFVSRPESVTSLVALDLIRALSAELAELYDHADDGTGGFDPAVEFEVRFLAGYLNGAPIACGAIRKLEESVGEIKRMFVLPEYRGRGFSKLLLARIEHQAYEAGYRCLRLETGDRQLAANIICES
ncbi:MAG: GNAT family N-acetyltransferase [Planctomycetota bacterium]